MSSSTGLGATPSGGFVYYPDQIPGFNYPPNQGGDDNELHTAYVRPAAMSQDWLQYYFGAARWTNNFVNATTTTFNNRPVISRDFPFMGMATFTPDAAAGNDPSTTAAGVAAPQPKSVKNFVLINTTHSPSQFPLFTANNPQFYQGNDATVAPAVGTGQALGNYGDNAYHRMATTITVPAAGTPALLLKLRSQLENNFDAFIVEAHTVGQENWTTLAGTGTVTGGTPATRNTSIAPGSSCPGWLSVHPFLTHYLTAPVSPATACTSSRSA
jgi:hypothetical protein